MNKSTDKPLPLLNPQGTDKEMLDSLQRETFEYFLKEVDPATGLVADKTQPRTPSSVAVVGMTLSAYIIGIENEFLTREEAVRRTHKILHFFYHSAQGTEPHAHADQTDHVRPKQIDHLFCWRRFSVHVLSGGS
jgi:hypothetical protein